MENKKKGINISLTYFLILNTTYSYLISDNFKVTGQG